ncbi:acetate--CoA ligase family protein [Hydrogenophaga sp.]|uniref:acetate--CoA ligase family protein n=1 Tax=Hydrogenophaga sp. TaxID=1904254 RepID=UPI00271995D8|nr:acetate--CoA ligase [Hydrogenophaga sp.]MDO9436685.1 acetate--CoA ligase family protein [Hydrogenophaga sp.]
MSLAQIQRIMNARSVAIYGASDDISKWGGGLMHQLRRHGWQGKIFPINRKEFVQGQKAYLDIGSIPEPVDLACVAVPVDQVGRVIGECADVGVAACLIISSNFAEAGEDGLRRQEELVEIASARGTRLLGPNCMGLMNTHAQFNLCNSASSEYYDHTPSGPIGIASQSGALMGTMLARSYTCGIGLSSGISVGNQADLEVADFFEYLIDDENTRIICLYIEEMRSPERFRELAQRSIAAGKPVLLVKAGRSEGGAHAVQSHTGSLAGTHESLAAVCHQLGVVLLDDVIDMIDIAMAWVSVGDWSEGGVAVATASGGGGALAMDALDAAGFSLPTLGASTQAALGRWAPPTHLQLPLDVGVLASHNPPRDLPQGILESLKAVMADDAVGAGIYVMTTQKNAQACWEAVIETAKTCGKPYVFVNQSSEVGSAASRAMREASLLEVTSLTSATTVLGGLRDIHRALTLPQRTAAVPPLDASVAALLPAEDGEPVTISEAETKAMLAAAGLPVPRQAMARDADEASRIAQEIGFPVVLKIDATGVTHKSDMGGVAVNLTTDSAVRAAFKSIAAAAERHLQPGQMQGCLVQQMVPGDVELIVGARWDAQFGTMVVVGVGGTLVELLHDVQILPAPFTREEVLPQLQRLKLYPLLTGYRGARPVDLDRLVDTVCRIGDFAASLGPRLLEFDANPVRISGSNICIADARAVIR